MVRKFTAFQRQRAIADFVRAHTSVNVDELAERFTVSHGTIRNDLNTLEVSGILVRVRGGAVIHDQAYLVPLATPNDAELVNGAARIAKWAAEQVSDGDVILLDAGTAAAAMAPHLRERRNLTVVTSRLETARLLAGDPSKTVILTGGVVRPDGRSVTGDLSHEAIRSLRIGTAFLSTAALSDVGLMESDPEAVRFKQQVLASASRIVALQERQTVGRVGLFTVVPASRLSQVFTDAAPDDETLTALQAGGTAVTVCGPDSVQTFRPSAVRDRYRIGFANLTEALLFPVDVRRSVERAAQGRGSLDLVMADNALDGQTAQRVAEHLIEQGIDLLIEYQLDDSANNRIMSLLQRHGIPVIAIDIPMVGATYFGVDHYRAGHLAGEGLGRWIEDRWAGRVDYVLVLQESRAGAQPAARIDGQIDGMSAALSRFEPRELIHLESGNTSEVSDRAVSDALGQLDSDRIAVVSFNDDAALGALKAVRDAGREQDVAIVGLGADRRMRRELRHPGTPMVGSTSFRPETYGPGVLDLAASILAGRRVPPAVYVEHAFITPGNVDQTYPDDPR